MQVFGDFCQDADGCVHNLPLVSWSIGTRQPCFQRFVLENGLTIKSLRQMNLEKAPTFPAALAFLKSKFLWLVAPLSAEMGWGCQCCEILQHYLNSINSYEGIGI
jgi:hypothetical protein